MLAGEVPGNSNAGAVSYGIWLLPMGWEESATTKTTNFFGNLGNSIKTHALREVNCAPVTGIGFGWGPPSTVGATLADQQILQDHTRHLQHCYGRPIQVLVTNFRLQLTFVDLSAKSTKEPSTFVIPVGSIEVVRRGKYSTTTTAAGNATQTTTSMYYIDVITKHCWGFRLGGHEELRIGGLCMELNTRLPRKIYDQFAFVYSTAIKRARRKAVRLASPESQKLVSLEAIVKAIVDPGWRMYNPMAELQRLTHVLNDDGTIMMESTFVTGVGVNIEPWFQVISMQPPKSSAGFPTTPALQSPSPESGRVPAPSTPPSGFVIVATPSNMVFPSTYPTQVIAPRAATAQLLSDVAKYRQLGRMPIISWINVQNGSVLARAGQPLPGPMARRDEKDELLCRMLNSSYLGGPPIASNVGTTQSSTFSDRVTLDATVNSQYLDVPDISSPQTRSRTPSGAIPIQPPPSLFETKADSVSRLPASLEPSSKSSTRKLHVIDCRSRTACAGQMAAGGGHELTAHYHLGFSHFLSIGNIHAVTKAFQGMKKLCLDIQRATPIFWSGGGGDDGGVGGGAGGGSGTTSSSLSSQHCNFWQKLDGTDWPTMVQKILCGANRVAELLSAPAPSSTTIAEPTSKSPAEALPRSVNIEREGSDSVLVHCTDGWDRTSQSTSLAMILLDQHYRTLGGFCTLIEQEWIRTGHRFADRCQNDGVLNEPLSKEQLEKNSIEETITECIVDGDEECEGESTSQHKIHVWRSPVFIQFLDCVYQLLCMHPTQFEFTHHFLQFLAEEVYSGRFGTFLSNCHRQRFQRAASGLLPIAFSTRSIWTEVATRTMRERHRRQNGVVDSGVKGLQGTAGGGAANLATETFWLNPMWVGCIPSDFGYPSNAPSLTKSGVQRCRLYISFASKHYHFWSAFFLPCDFEMDPVAASSDPSTMYSALTASSIVLSGLPHIVQRARGARERANSMLSSEESNMLGTMLSSVPSFPEFTSTTPSVAVCRDPISQGMLHVLAQHQACAALLRSISPETATQQKFFEPTDDAQGEEAAVCALWPNTLSVEQWLKDEMPRDGIVTIPKRYQSQLTEGGTKCLFYSDSDEESPAAATATPLETAPRSRHKDPPPTVNPPVEMASPQVQHRDAEFYLPREQASVCYLCDTPFTLFYRRHTCRMCCRTVCGECGSHFVPLNREQIAVKEDKGKKEPLRVCKVCYVKLRTE